MKPRTYLLVVPVLLLMSLSSLSAQDNSQKNPLAGQSQAALQGQTIYRDRCAGCHGADASGGAGPNLIAVVGSGASDERLFQTIRNGVTGTSMPAMAAGQSDADIWKVITYLRSVASVSNAATPAPTSPTTQPELANRPVDIAPLISWQDLQAGLANPARWLSYSGDLRGQRHSPLTQITPANVGHLVSQWEFQSNTVGKFEASALAIDGTIYITGANNYAWAIDARTGRQIWRYRRQLPNPAVICCGPVNRGFAVLNGKLYMGTLDAHLIALDIKTGALVWDSPMADGPAGYATTMAPLVVKDKIIAGVAGSDNGIRGFVDAYDAETGKRDWRFYTTAGPGDPGNKTWQGDSWQTGGGSVWTPASYDPESNLIFIGTGNPGPDYNGDNRAGDNLYTNSLLALVPDTGELRWYYQFTPHDLHDWDSSHTPIVADIRIAGDLRKVVMVANRDGFFYTLDRFTGKVILARPFINTTWAKEIGPDGRPVWLPDQIPTEQGTTICPDQYGGTNFMPPSFDAQLGLVFLSARERCATYQKFAPNYSPGHLFTSGATKPVTDGSVPAKYGALRAIDPATGAMKWELRYPVYDMPGFPGVLSTASGLVFASDDDGNFMAVDSQTGKKLWSYQLGSAPDGYRSGNGIYSGATTFMVGTRQYVLIAAGATLTAFALSQTGN